MEKVSTHLLRSAVLIGLILLSCLSCRESVAKDDVQSPQHQSRNTCNNLPGEFMTYDEAKAAVEGATFKIREDISTENSAWIRGASYFSCDGLKGYFLLKTDKKQYLFQGMPLEVWEGFKNANSAGQYYHSHIRDRYYLYVGQE